MALWESSIKETSGTQRTDIRPLSVATWNMERVAFRSDIGRATATRPNSYAPPKVVNYEYGTHVKLIKEKLSGGRLSS